MALHEQEGDFHHEIARPLAPGRRFAGRPGPACLAAGAQDFPRKPITLVVPYAAGGGTDVVARSLAEQMSKQLGQPVIVDNKPGASGILGTSRAAKAAARRLHGAGRPDTIAAHQPVPLREAALRPAARAEPGHADRPRAAGAAGAGGSKVRNVADLQRELRAGSQRRQLRLLGRGLLPAPGLRLHGLDLEGRAGPCRLQGRSADAAGPGRRPARLHVSAAWSRPSPTWTAASCAPSPSPATSAMPMLPEVPTFNEAGFPDAEYRMSGWLALAVTQATPKPVVAAPAGGGAAGHQYARTGQALRGAGHGQGWEAPPSSSGKTTRRLASLGATGQSFGRQTGLKTR